MPDDPPTVDEIFANHEEVVDRYDLNHGGIGAFYPRRKLEDALTDAATRDDPHLRAAALLKRLVELHLFEDGNKRTAWLTVAEYLHRVDDPPTEAGPDAARVLKHLRRYSEAELSAWLRDGTLDRSRLRD